MADVKTDKRVLIVDDEPDLRELVAVTLSQMGLRCFGAENLVEARDLILKEHFDLCLTDLRLPDGDGIQVVETIQQHQPDTAVAVITAYGNMDSAISALKAGAFDFLSKPVQLQQLRDLVSQALELSKLTGNGHADLAVRRLIGDAPVIRELRQQIQKLARSQAPIHIHGESGTGKEVVAHLLHDLGPRAEGPFVPVNCGAIPTELMESEFFGHKKGSFSGAVEDKPGLFAAAQGGTLFLDEVADLPLAMQVKLLRAIQEKKVRPVGAHQETPIDARILSATHQDLRRNVEQGSFREDLFYRIHVIELRMPSLRERREDIPLLARTLLKRIARDYHADAPQISDGAIAALQSHSFPGNVRELENTLERAFALCEQGRITAGDLQLTPGGVAAEAGEEPAIESPAPAAEPPGRAGAEGSLESYLEAIEKQAILKALEETRWNKTQAAKRLGISFRALRYRLKKLDLE